MEKHAKQTIVLSQETCPVTLTLSILGGHWKGLILYAIYLGVHRFGELQRTIPEISKKMLTQELRDLEKNGLIHREIFAEIPPRVEYTLTELGTSSFPIFQAMITWGNHYREIQKSE